MAGEENLQSAKNAYQAFINGDAAGAMANMADDIEWIQPGNSTVGGPYRGKQEIGQLWGKFLEKNLKVNPQYWYHDDERVVVLTQNELDGHQADGVDVLTFRDGKLVKFQTAGDTALLEEIFGRK